MAASAKDEGSVGVRIGRDLAWAVALIALMILLKTGIEHTDAGKWLSLKTYSLLQFRLSSTAQPEDPPITLIDIRPIAPSGASAEDRTTPRDALTTLLRTIVKQQPVAIGVDIDFSPNERGYITPADPAFFEFCLSLRDRDEVPVYLGVYRTTDQPPGTWLGDDHFQRLAANISIPKDTRSLPDWLQARGSSTPLPSMSAALARTAPQPAPNPLGLPRWAFRSLLQEERKALTIVSFLVDYSVLGELQRRKLMATRRGGIVGAPDGLHDHLVLLGDGAVQHEEDSFAVPGRGGRIPGSMVHASALYTLLKGPLFELTEGGRVAIDAGLSLVILLILTAARLLLGRGENVEAPSLWPSFGVTLTVCALAFLVGWQVHRHRVLWDDFLLVILVLLIHAPFEHVTEPLRRDAELRGSQLWQRMRSSPSHGPQRPAPQPPEGER
jgi:CHASE2 domain-containing sensor protein